MILNNIILLIKHRIFGDLNVKKSKEQKKETTKLFCPSYESSSVLKKQNKVAKKFVRITMASFDEIERFEKTAEFKNQVALAINVDVAENFAQEQEIFIKEVKICTLKKQLDQTTKILHLEDALSKEKLDQLKQNIIASYSSLKGSNNSEQNRMSFAKQVNAIVDSLLYDISYLLVKQIDVPQPNKYKKVEL